MSENVAQLEQFATQPLLLRRRIARAFAGARSKHIMVGLLCGERVAHAVVGDAAEAASAAPTRAEARAHGRCVSTMPTGCITKLFTAALVEDFVSIGRFGLDGPVAELLAPRLEDSLRGVTVRHLLEHTHGLDDSAIHAVPRRSDGFIDGIGLRRQLSAVQRLARPGELYSYGNAGAWLLAALLEHCSGRRYETLLQSRLFARLGITVDHAWRRVAERRHGAVCPSTGGSLALSVEDLLKFLRRSIGCAEQWPSDAATGTPDGIVPLPGWNALECGVYLGWKHHGAGWFGHSSALPGASAMVRVLPRHKIALVIASRHHPAAIVAARLFGRLLPELVRFEIPRSLSRDELLRVPFNRYAGRYRSAARAVSIRSSRHGLELGAVCGPTRRGADRPRSARATLRAAARHVFFTNPPGIAEFPFVQFIAPEGGAFAYLWNGRFVLRRAASRACDDE